MVDEEGKSKQFGFVCFETYEAAEKALKEEHEKEVEGKKLYVARAEKKEERKKALQKSMARKNLYIRNFDKDVKEEDLKKFFSTFGAVKNVKIMVTELPDGSKESKGFGFVCYEDAETAVKVELLASQN